MSKTSASETSLRSTVYYSETDLLVEPQPNACVISVSSVHLSLEHFVFCTLAIIIGSACFSYSVQLCILHLIIFAQIDPLIITADKNVILLLQPSCFLFSSRFRLAGCSMLQLSLGMPCLFLEELLTTMFGVERCTDSRLLFMH